MIASGQAALFDAIGTAADAAQADVFAHAVDIGSGRQIGLRADEPDVSASVFKVPVLTEYVRQVAAGQLDPAARITIGAGSGTTGPTGLSVFLDDAEWSLRDIATSMITVSDNAATDIVMRIVGIERSNVTTSQLGLPDAVLVGDCAAIFASIADEMGVDDEAAIEAELVADPERVARLSVCRPEGTNRTTRPESVGASKPAAASRPRTSRRRSPWPPRGAARSTRCSPTSTSSPCRPRPSSPRLPIGAISPSSAARSTGSPAVGRSPDCRSSASRSPAPAGLPVGAQLVGRRGADRALLSVGEAVQAVSDWHDRCPPGALAADVWS